MNKAKINKCDCTTKYIEAKTETHNAYAGGFVGVNSDGTINECTTKNSSEKTDASEKTRSVEAKSNSGQAKVGGFVGVNEAEIKKSDSIGHHIYLSSGVCWEDNGCGGFVGKNDKGGDIDDCKVEGVEDDGGKETIKCKVETKRKKKGGGFVGEAEDGSTIKNCTCESVRVKKGKTISSLNELIEKSFYYKKSDKAEIL